MTFHVPNAKRIKSGKLGSSDSAGNNGAFSISLGASARAFVIASDGLGWEHVSVTIIGVSRCPTWEEMSKIKSIFWDDDDCVVQFHPPKKANVNMHPFCLHLWRPLREGIPVPNPLLVGFLDAEGR